MQKLSLSEDEQMSRKEYLKNKRRSEKKGVTISKKKFVIAVLVVILLAYVVIQLYIYYQKNNYTYLSVAEVDSQKVYDIYYMSEGYTYNPSSSLNFIKSDSFDLKRIYTDLGFEQIQVSGNKLFGIKDKKLYFLNLDTENVLTEVHDGEVYKYEVYGDTIYVINKERNKIYRINSNDIKDKSEYEKSGVAELLVDDNYLFLCIENKNKKELFRFDRNMGGELKLTDSQNVSYIIQDESNIYFVNKADENRIYKVKKDGGVEKISDEVKSVTDKGEVAYIDGSKYMFCYKNELYYVNTDDKMTLWKVNLESKEKSKVLFDSIEILQNVDDTVFYKIEDQRGLYLYNVDTKFSSEVSSRLITEFVVKK